MGTPLPDASAMPAGPRDRRLIVVALVGAAAAALAAWLVLGSGRADATSPFSGQVVAGTLFVQGSGGNDTIDLRLRSGVPTTLDVDFGNDGTVDLSFDRSTFSAIHVDALGGADVVRIDEINGVFTDTDATTIDGGSGNDTLFGGSGAETLIGNGGNDVVQPGRGNDLALLGGGTDTVTWNPGDGSDTVEGQTGNDTLLFNGANVAENVGVSANGSRVRFTRDVGAITMDLAGVENIRFNAQGGADHVLIDDLTGTDVRRVAVDLSVNGSGDGQADQVTVNGTANADRLSVLADGSAAEVAGLSMVPSVTGAEPALDQLVVNGQGGDDSIEGSPAVGALVNAVIDGGPGNDTAFADGTRGDDTFLITPNGTQAQVSDGTGGFFSIAGAENVRVSGGGGNDTITGSNGLAAIIPTLTLDGGGGNDTITGGDGADVIIGGGGSDLVFPGRGNDLALLGGGSDTAVWNPGDGSDTIEGQTGKDALVFNGANVSENMAVSANGSRVRFTRDVGAITMDLNEVETLNVKTLGGADVVNVGDLTGTTARAVNVDLQALGGVGDGQADRVVVDGTPGDDRLMLSGAGPAATVKGLAVVPSVIGAEPTLDTLVVNGQAGNDTMEVSPGDAAVSLVADGGADTDTVSTEGTNGDDLFQVTPGVAGVRVTNGLGQFFEAATPELLNVSAGGGNDTIVGANGVAPLVSSLRLDGGSGNDTITGTDAADTIVGGGNDDVVIPARGNDVVLLGSGNDTVAWNPGDGSDTVEGQGGSDALVFNGANVNENIAVSANGSRVRLTRDVANITMDFDGIETLNLRALGGADTVTVGDLTGTAMRHVAVDLGSSGGTGDAQADRVIVNGTAGIDKIAVAGSGTSATVTGLAASVDISNAEFTNDALFVETGAGADTVDFAGLPPGVIQLFVDGSRVV